MYVLVYYVLNVDLVLPSITIRYLVGLRVYRLCRLCRIVRTVFDRLRGSKVKKFECPRILGGGVQKFRNVWKTKKNFVLESQSKIINLSLLFSRNHYFGPECFCRRLSPPPTQKFSFVGTSQAFFFCQESRFSDKRFVMDVFFRLWAWCNLNREKKKVKKIFACIFLSDGGIVSCLSGVFFLCECVRVYCK